MTPNKRKKRASQCPPLFFIISSILRGIAAPLPYIFVNLTHIIISLNNATANSSTSNTFPQTFKKSFAFFIDNHLFLWYYIYITLSLRGVCSAPSVLGVWCLLWQQDFKNGLETHCRKCEFGENTQHLVKIAVDFREDFGSFLFGFQFYHPRPLLYLYYIISIVYCQCSISTNLYCRYCICCILTIVYK